VKAEEEAKVAIVKAVKVAVITAAASIIAVASTLQ
jgi:hypothetical protein